MGPLIELHLSDGSWLAQEHPDDAADLLPANVADLLDALHPLAALQAARVPARREDGVDGVVQADRAGRGLQGALGGSLVQQSCS